MPPDPSQFDPPGSEPAASTRHRLQAVVLIVLLALVACWAVILSGNLKGRAASDDLLYHWIAINQFAQQWPAPDLSDYASATTPGYHLVLSVFVKMGLGHTGAQLLASLWTLALLGTMCWVVTRHLGRVGALLVMPMLASVYVLFPGIWLLPDNAGWLLVLLIVLLALRESPGWGTWALSGVLLVVLVWLRQVHIWAAAPIWLAAWLGTTAQTPTGLLRLFSSPTQRIGRVLIAIGCTVPAFMTLAWFMGTWGGLVPPMFQDMHQGPNLATPGFMLMQLAVLSVFFSPILLPRLRMVWAHHWRWVLLVGCVGLLLGLLPSSSYSVEQGRYSGWWNLIKTFPVVADRSPLFVLGSFLGSIALVLWLSLCTSRDAWIWIGLLVAFTLAQSANHASWQRYHEPMLLIMLVLILARSNQTQRTLSWVALSCVLLTLMLGAISVMTLMTGKPVDVVSMWGPAGTNCLYWL